MQGRSHAPICPASIIGRRQADVQLYSGRGMLVRKPCHVTLETCSASWRGDCDRLFRLKPPPTSGSETRPRRKPRRSEGLLEFVPAMAEKLLSAAVRVTAAVQRLGVPLRFWYHDDNVNRGTREEEAWTGAHGRGNASAGTASARRYRGVGRLHS